MATSRIGILTLYRSLNAGAFLQAYSLQEVIQELGFSPSFLNIYRSSFKYQQLRRLISRIPRKTVFKLKSWNAYHQCWSLLNQSALTVNDDLSSLDKVVVGSDELWNLDNDSFRSITAFFGVGINRPCIAYAPSLNKCSYEKIKEDKNDLISGLQSFAHVSARDSKTLALLNAVRQEPVIRALDPTFLYPLKKKICPTNERGFILLYALNLTNEQKEIVKQIAAVLNKKILSVATYNAWADVNIACNPFELLGFIESADYIITDTFHGTILSMQFKKQFAVVNTEKPKVLDILQHFQLESRMADGFEEIFDLLGSNISYNEISNQVHIEAEESLAYLEASLSSA